MLREHLGRYLERYFSRPMPFLVLELADLMRAEKENCMSKIIPRCFGSSTFFVGLLLKRIT